MVHGPTRVTQTSETLIDLLFCTTPGIIVHSACEELGLSDHNMICGIFNGSIEKQKQFVHEVRALGIAAMLENWLQI